VASTTTIRLYSANIFLTHLQLTSQFTNQRTVTKLFSRDEVRGSLNDKRMRCFQYNNDC